MRFLLSRLAEQDLEAQLDFLLARSPPAAESMLESVLDVLARLANGEFDGREVVLRSGARVHRWPVPPLVIYYRREGDVLRVVRIHNAMRRPLEK